MACHETALELASESGTLPLQVKAAVQLCGVYKVLAEQLLDTKTPSPSNVAAAADLFEKCVACAKLAKDEQLEGVNCHRLGKVKLLSGEYEEALSLQTHYLEICEAHNDRSGEAAARAALAQTYEVVGDVDSAIQQLELLLSVAAEAGELQVQAQACLNLGLLYSEGDAYQLSVQLLERHFHLARQLSDRDLVDAARVILGMARGNGKLPQYVRVLCNDLPKLLDWKSRRVPLGDAPAATSAGS